MRIQPSWATKSTAPQQRQGGVLLLPLTHPEQQGGGGPTPRSWRQPAHPAGEESGAGLWPCCAKSHEAQPGIGPLPRCHQGLVLHPWAGPAGAHNIAWAGH